MIKDLNVVRHITTLMLLMVFSIGIAISANAQTAAESPCDPEYYKSLESRAWLEAQREVTQNQNLIFKPDSVLEYTCFDRHLNVLAQQASSMFSENDGRWGRAVLPDTSMDQALESLVGGPARDYLTQNFETNSDGSTYDLLGGRITNGLDHNPAPQVTGGGYECDVMNQVWQMAKCMDFAATPAEDGFFTFADYQNNADKRHLPFRCDAINDRWKTEREVALQNDKTPWEEDPLRTYLNTVDASQCTSSTPIETGLIIRRSKGVAEYTERVCITPGCTFVPASGGGSCQNI